MNASSIRFYEVGGCVRDDLLGIPSKDIDFVCEAQSFAEMESHLISSGFKIYLRSPEFTTLRCGIPESNPLRLKCKSADFVLARRDGPTLDGRRPQFVEPGTLADDLARRDFTINALARCVETQSLIDYNNGLEDLKTKTLRFVGDPIKRITEDGLRVLRGFRFSITKNLTIEAETNKALRSDIAADMLSCVSIERIREEVEKMFLFNTRASISLLNELPEKTLDAIFRENLRLVPTLRK